MGERTVMDSNPSWKRVDLLQSLDPKEGGRARGVRVGKRDATSDRKDNPSPLSTLTSL